MGCRAFWPFRLFLGGPYQQSCWWARLSHKDSNSFCMMITGWADDAKAIKWMCWSWPVTSIALLAPPTGISLGVSQNGWQDLPHFPDERVGVNFGIFHPHVTDLWRKVYLRSNSFGVLFVTHDRSLLPITMFEVWAGTHGTHYNKVSGLSSTWCLSWEHSLIKPV